MQDKENIVFEVSQMIRDSLLETGCGIPWGWLTNLGEEKYVWSSLSTVILQ